MTERILTLPHALARLLVPFVPMMTLCVVISALAALTLAVVHTNSEQYKLTPWTGAAIFLPQAAGSATAVAPFTGGRASIGVGQTNATPPDRGRAD
jgi:hypothetical protein